MIRAFLVTFVTFAYIAVLGPPYLIYALISGDSRPLYDIGKLGTKMAVALAGVRLVVHGQEKIPAGRAVVFMANHQSNCDPPAAIAILPRVVVMAKKEFFRIPVLGRGMKACGFIPVNRRNREEAMAAVEKGVIVLKSGRSFLVYPEGTRSPDGRLQRFKKGVFIMAIKAGVPIVPVSISGGRKIMPKGEFVMRPGPVRITFHDPVSTEGLTVENRQVLIDRVRGAILTGLDEDELPLNGREA